MAKQGKGANLKGANFERRIARELEAWWGEYDTDAEFARVPRSGGIAKLREGWKLAGDITCSSSEFPFHMELKNHETWRVDQIFKGTGPVIESFWTQTISGNPTGRHPLLVISRNRRPDFCVLRYFEGVLAEFVRMNIPFMWFTVIEPEDKEINLMMFLFEDMKETDPAFWVKHLAIE